MSENRYENKNASEHDELRARFTGCLDTVVYRAKLKYLRKQEREFETAPIDDIPEQYMECHEPGYSSVGVSTRDFDFEEEKLAAAFSQLPLMRKEVLRLLFVEEMEPAEIAARLNCSVHHVDNQRSLAIRKLRSLLEMEGGQE